MHTDVLTDTSCYHCGEICSTDTVYLNDKPFCCNGCSMVYEILDQHELSSYYCLETQPGTSFKNNTGATRFDYLDDDSVIERIIDFRNDQFATTRLYIPNVHCTSCVWLLENLFKLDAGITKSSVNFMKRELSVTYQEDKTSLRKVVELLASIGYEPELRLEKLDKKHYSSPNRRLWLKLGVAGFAFGNIMLFSFPEYLSGSTLSSGGSFHIFFGILNIALALPVLLYSGSDYLKSAWASVKQGGINLDVPISIGMLALFGRSAYEIVAGAGAGYMDSFTGLVFFLLIGRLIQKKTFEHLSFDRDFKSYLPISVTITERDGANSSVSIDQLEKGTSILIRNQELVPADSLLTSDEAYIDYSFITGESEPVKAEQGDTIYAGGKIMGTSAQMSTIKEVSNSYLTKLWNDTAFDAQKNRSPLSSLAERISPHFTITVLTIALNAAILWWPAGFDMSLTVFTAVLIIACPCALALSTPFTLGSALNIFARNGLYIKGIDVVERLANATALVFDKTGTLTKVDTAEVTYHGNQLSSYEQQLVKTVCKQSIHPLSQKIASYLDGKTSGAIQTFDEILNKGITATIDGIPLLLGSASFIKEQLGPGIAPPNDRRTAATSSYLAIDNQLVGRFEIGNAYRPGIKDLLRRLHDRFSMFLISGDHEAQKAAFKPYFEVSSLQFNQTPKQKLAFIKNLQDEGETVVMIGDGLNDAGALQQSDFGIALTENVSSFTPASDAILDGAALQHMDAFVDFAKRSMTIIKLSFGLSLLYNIAGIGFAVAGHLSPLVAAILMPLSSVSIMAFTMAGTHLTAKNMGLLTWK